MPALLAGPLLKVAGVAVLILALIGMGEWHGRQAVQQEWDAAITEQQMATGENIVKNAQNTARIESEFQRKLEAQAARVRIVNKEVKVYVESPSTKCDISPEFERVFDAVSRMHEPSADGLSATPDAPGAALELPGARVTDAEILQAYQLAVVELFNLWDTYHALVAWTRSSYAVANDGAGR